MAILQDQSSQAESNRTPKQATRKHYEKALIITLLSICSANIAVAKNTDKGLAQATPAQWCKAKKADRIDAARELVGELWLGEQLKQELAAAIVVLAQDKDKLEKAVKTMATDLETAITTAMCEKDGSVNPDAKKYKPAEFAVLAAALMGWLK